MMKKIQIFEELKKFSNFVISYLPFFKIFYPQSVCFRSFILFS